MSKLSQRVREARKSVELSQEALALELNVSRSAVAQWEMEDGTSPSVENLIALARRTGTSFEYLATGRGDRFHSKPIPAITEERSTYSPLTDQQLRLLKLFDALSPRQRSGLLDLLAFAEGPRKR
ncbi:MAG: helix-turn-helix domain-containing protein [Solimonas sp.]